MTDDGMLVSKDSVPLFVSDRQDRGSGWVFHVQSIYQSLLRAVMMMMMMMMLTMIMMVRGKNAVLLLITDGALCF